MAVAVVSNPSSNNFTASSSFIDFTFTMGAGISNPALVAVVAWTGPVVLNSVTWDNGGTNQNVPIIIQVSGGVENCALAGLVGSITTGTLTLRANLASATGGYLSCVSFSGVDQTGGATSFPNATNTGNAPPSVTVTSVAGDMVIGCCSMFTGTVTVSGTQIFQDTRDGVNAFANYDNGAAPSVTLSASGATPSNAYAGMDIKASSGGGGSSSFEIENPSIYVTRKVTAIAY